MRLLHAAVSLLALASCGFAQNSPTATTNPIVSYAYTGSDARTSSGVITPYAVRADGSATRLSIVSGPALGVVVTSGFVFAHNLTQITTYTRNANGTLRRTSTINATAHNDAPNGSGLGALSLDHTGRSLYAGEIDFQGADNNAYAQFSIGTGGKLSFVANSTINVDFGGRMVFSPGNRFAYGSGCFFANWDVFGLTRATNGKLTQFDPAAAIPPSPAIDTPCPGPAAVSARSIVALSYGDASGGNRAIATYVIQQNGTLTLVTNSEKVTTFTGINDLWFDPTGNWLAVVGFNGLQIFHLLANGQLAAGPHVLTGTHLFSVKWDTRGHVVATNSSALYIYKFSNGTLKAAAGSPHATTTASTSGLAVLPVAQ